MALVDPAGSAAAHVAVVVVVVVVADPVEALPTTEEVEGAWVGAACALLVAACNNLANTLALPDPTHWHQEVVEDPTTAFPLEDIEEALPSGTEMASPCKEEEEEGERHSAPRKTLLQKVHYCTTPERTVEGIVAETAEVR